VKLFLDTANIDEIAEINRWGVLAGVTTNPTLAMKEGKDFASMIKEICAEVDGDVSAEVISTNLEDMVSEGRKLAQIADNVVVKIPLIPEGLGAVKQLSKDGIRTNVTLCFSPTQAILAAQAGASFVSPFLGRLDDIAADGIDLLERICAMAASLRHPQHVVDAALAGADVATMPVKVFRQMVTHPLTDKGLDAFLADWTSYQEAMKASGSAG
jgi:transaldolase